MIGADTNKSLYDAMCEWCGGLVPTLKNITLQAQKKPSDNKNFRSNIHIQKVNKINEKIVSCMQAQLDISGFGEQCPALQALKSGKSEYTISCGQITENTDKALME